jgi:tetratricopeptide (TPR) repeat protein
MNCFRSLQVFSLLVVSAMAVFSQEAPKNWPSLDEKPTIHSDQTQSRPPELTGLDAYEQRLVEAVKKFDDTKLTQLLEECLPVLSTRTTDFRAQIFIAKCYLARCDLRRFMRKTYELERKRDKELRAEDATLGEMGVPFAQQAITLDPSSSEAHRVLGELYIHQITGPITGFRFGPKGKVNIEKALELDPKNHEARRAIGLMYLYNPPINGGDTPLAAQTFDQAIQMGGDDRSYVLAARAYLKLEDKQTATQRLKKAITLNPSNIEAKALLKETEQQ